MVQVPVRSLPRELAAVEPHRARAGGHEAGQRHDQRRLADPVAPEQPEHGACGKVEVDAVQHHAPVVPGDEPADLEETHE
jgi:hypothetical protein